MTPSPGFVTGGDWIEFPVGIFKNNAGLKGKASFGFNARYKRGASVLSSLKERRMRSGTTNKNKKRNCKNERDLC